MSVGKPATDTAVGHQGSFALGGLGLFAGLFLRLLLFHLLVAQGGEAAGRLLDLSARHVHADLFDEFLGPEGVVRARRGGDEQRDKHGG